MTRMQGVHKIFWLFSLTIGWVDGHSIPQLLNMFETGQDQLKSERRDGRIFGGTVVSSATDFPWRVGIMMQTAKGLRVGAGSIIHNRWILTAAHNFEDPSDEYYKILYGGPQWNSDMSIELENKQIFKHPSYDPKSLQNDIALVLLTDTQAFNFDTKIVASIALPIAFRNTPPDYFAGADKTFVAAGWGKTSANSQISQVLMQTPINFIGQDDCKQMVVGSKDEVVFDTQICTFTLGHDTCSGDSGSTVDYVDSKNPLNNYAVAIVSFGEPCGNDKYPGRNTRITSYLDWIGQTTTAAGVPVSVT